LNRHLGRVTILGLLCVMPAAVLAQTVANDFQESQMNYGMQQLKVVAGQVITAQGSPIVHASIEVLNNAGAPPRILQTDANGRFQSDYEFMLDSDEVRHFNVSLKVTKKGFQPVHKFSEISATKVVGMSIIMRPLQPEDPAQLSQADLIKAIAPRLRQLNSDDGLGAKDAKEYERGVQEFLDRNHLDLAIPHLYKVVKDSPQCLRCRTMLGLADLSWGDWDGAQHEVGDSVNAYIKDRSLGSFEPLFVQGTFSSWGGNSETATAYLKEAVKYAPRDPLGLRELGRAEALDLDWPAASESLKSALAYGASPETRLNLAEALCWAGTPDQAEAELKQYLNGRDLKNAPPQARTIWENIQVRKKNESQAVAYSSKVAARGEPPVDYLHSPPIANLPDFEPATDQAPLPAILEAVGNNVSELFANLPNISSVEDVHQEMLNRKGKTVSARKYKYRYLLTAPDKRWGLSITEYRADFQGHETSQLGVSDNYMLTSGFVSTPLVFYPPYQAGSIFRLLGRQKLNGRTTFVVAYAQQPAKARNYGSFQQGNGVTVIYSQGMAWIDSENYQIIRLTTDLLRPAPLVRLNKITTEIGFSGVQFKKPARTFWLPDNVMVTLDWNGRHLRNNHTYSDFLVFNVDSSEKIAAPKHAEKTVDEVPPNAVSSSAPPVSDAAALVKP
jgi:tetratricopeptide (TPR) repeat protein